MSYAKPILVSLLVFVLINGCFRPPESKALNTLPDKIKAETVVKISEMKAKLKASHYTDWLLALFILAAATGIFTTIRGRPVEGLAVIGGSIGGIVLTLYTQRAYELPLVWMFGGLLILIGFVAFLYRDRIGKAAFKNVATGWTLTKAQSKLIEKVRSK